MSSVIIISANSVVRCVAVLLLCALGQPVSADVESEKKIGVLAFRGESAALEMWEPTADYLSSEIPGHKFRIIPLNLQGMNQAVRSKAIDFIFTNPGNYVDLEARYGASRIATLRNLRQGVPFTVFGAVIFTQAGRSDIRTLQDLKGKSFMAVGKDAFGGFQMAWRELKEQGINPFSDATLLRFSGFPQDNIVYAVRDGKVDAGTVRSDTLTRMVQEGKVGPDELRVLNRKNIPGYPFPLSTGIYPEWPFSRLKHTSEELGQQVAIALLTLSPGSPVALAGRSGGWTIPLDYGPVHDLFRSLQIGPYRAMDEVSLSRVLATYWRWLLGGLLILVLMGLAITYVIRINRRLEHSHQVLQGEVAERKQTQTQLAQHRDTLEQQVQARTRELQDDIQARQLAEDTLRRSESALRRLHEITISADTKFQSKLHDLLEMGCEHFEMPSGMFSRIHEKSYEIIDAVSPGKHLVPGSLMPLENTFCQVALASRCAVAIRDIGKSIYRDLPVVQQMGLEAYFGTTVQVAGNIYGTLCFLSTEYRDKPFTSVDKDILQLVAQWIGEEIERQNTQDQARRHQDALAHVSRLGAMGQMASALAHELNQPLTALVNYTRGCIRRLEAGKDNAEVLAGAMEQAASEAERAAEIVRGLREFVRKDESQRTPIAINNAVYAVAGLAENEAREQGVVLELSLQEDLPAITADMIQIQQVMLNLIRNALESMADVNVKDKRLFVSALHPDDKNIEVVIRDTGCGFPQVPVEELFDPFFTTKVSGLGMGLSISRSIIEAHGGRLHAEPAQGGGSIFLFTLPVCFEKHQYGS